MHANMWRVRKIKPRGCSLSLRLRQYHSVRDTQREIADREHYHVGPQQLVNAPFPTEISCKTKGRLSNGAVLSESIKKNHPRRRRRNGDRPLSNRMSATSKKRKITSINVYIVFVHARIRRVPGAVRGWQQRSCEFTDFVTLRRRRITYRIVFTNGITEKVISKSIPDRGTWRPGRCTWWSFCKYPKTNLKSLRDETFFRARGKTVRVHAYYTRVCIYIILCFFVVFFFFCFCFIISHDP